MFLLFENAPSLGPKFYLLITCITPGWRQGRARRATAPSSGEASPPVGVEGPICRSTL